MGEQYSKTICNKLPTLQLPVAVACLVREQNIKLCTTYHSTSVVINNKIHDVCYHTNWSHSYTCETCLMPRLILYLDTIMLVPGSQCNFLYA